MLFVDLASDRRIHRGRRCHISAVCAHHFTAERLLFVGNLHHVYLAVKAEVRAGHGKRRAPLTGSGLCRHAFEALLLCVVSLCDCRIQLMAPGCIVAFKLVEYMSRRIERLLQKDRVNKRRRPVHFVKILNLIRNRDERGIIVQFLSDQLVAEDRLHILEFKRLQRTRMNQRRRFVLHIRADIIPFCRDLILGEIDLVRDIIFTHNRLLSSAFRGGAGKNQLKKLLPVYRFCRDKSSIYSCGATLLDALMRAHSLCCLKPQKPIPAT